MGLVIQENSNTKGRHKVDEAAAEAVWASRGWETIGPAATGYPDDLRTAGEAAQASKKKPAVTAAGSPEPPKRGKTPSGDAANVSKED